MNNEFDSRVLMSAWNGPLFYHHSGALFGCQIQAEFDFHTYHAKNLLSLLIENWKQNSKLGLLTIPLKYSTDFRE